MTALSQLAGTGPDRTRKIHFVTSGGQAKCGWKEPSSGRYDIIAKRADYQAMVRPVTCRRCATHARLPRRWTNTPIPPDGSVADTSSEEEEHEFNASDFSDADTVASAEIERLTKKQENHAGT